ncbi:MAG: hypothetical protein ABW039_08585 [Sphingobium sp.]
MAEPKDPDALTEDGRAPVLGEDQEQEPVEPQDDDASDPKAIDLPLEENDFNSQPG